MQGLQAQHLKDLERLYRRKVDPQYLCTPELLDELSHVSFRVGRQVGLIVGRDGEITHVIAGTSQGLLLPDLGRGRAAQTRFRGLRLVHTRFRSAELARDDLTDLALLHLDSVLVVQAVEYGPSGPVNWAHLKPRNQEGELWRTETLAGGAALEMDFLSFIQGLEREFYQQAGFKETRAATRAMLIHVVALKDRAAVRRAESSLLELQDLARSAGLAVVDTVMQRRPQLDPKYIVGRGKLQEVVARALQQMADVLVFDHDLSPSQMRNITDTTDFKILDRSQLILDIFAQRARTQEGKLQVELAQLKYRLPRLIHANTGLSRLMGGIGGRGPGESKLESDRRRVAERIHRLEREVEQIGKQRQNRRQKRQAHNIPVVSIVGYTNSGKSTLLNVMTKSAVLVENKLFATLDPTTRRMRFPLNREIVLTDTVGFIQNLPQDLLRAFSATLEELTEASLLLHVVDGSSLEHLEHLAVVNAMLTEMELDRIPRIVLLSKIELVPEGERAGLCAMHNALGISSHARIGLNELLERMEWELFKDRMRPSAEA